MSDARRGGNLAPTFDLVTSKLEPPPTRPGTVVRLPLLERLARDEPGPIVSVAAPAGYGKTTLLSQWAERSSHAFAWMSVEESDDDPKVLLRYVAEAMDGVEPVDEGVFEALSSAGTSVLGSVVPRLASAFSSMTTPVVLVLDDAHLLRDRVCHVAVSALADAVPPGSRLVLAGRAVPPLRIGRLRAEGRILEIGAADLALTLSDAAALLGNAGLELSPEEAAQLQDRTEGWPAGLYLVALYLREGGSMSRVAGYGQMVQAYIESEVLSRISGSRRLFLTRSAVLEQMSGPLCDAVVGQNGAQTVLTELERSNLLLVPLDRRREWYRYHRLFRAMLLSELERQEPDLIPALRRRAAAWCVENHRPEEALGYAMAAGDVPTSASLVEGLAVPLRRQGRTATLRRWFGWLQEQDGVEDYPVGAALAGLIYAWMGRPADAERWAATVDRWQRARPTDPANTVAQAWAALLQAMLCRRGVQQMIADADKAARWFETSHVVTSGPALLQGIGHVLRDDPYRGDGYLEKAVDLAQSTGAPEVAGAALSERALVAISAGDWDRAEAFARQARIALSPAGTGEGYFTPLVCAVRARVALQRGDLAVVREQLVSAQRLRPLQTYVVPHVAAQTRLELARINLRLGDFAGARTLMREVTELLRRRPDLGIVARDARALWPLASRQSDTSVVGASALTAAELRLMPLLSTHLSYAEIGDELELSKYTVKSQVSSVYRKLGVSSRGQAVVRSRELGLLEGLTTSAGHAQDEDRSA